MFAFNDYRIQDWKEDGMITRAAQSSKRAFKGQALKAAILGAAVATVGFFATPTNSVASVPPFADPKLMPRLKSLISLPSRTGLKHSMPACKTRCTDIRPLTLRILTPAF